MSVSLDLSLGTPCIERRGATLPMLAPVPLTKRLYRQEGAMPIRSL